MAIVQHEFTKKIIEILNCYFPSQGNAILNYSELLQYLNIKTKAANRGSKSRAGLANHYAIYVLVEDYLNKKFHLQNNYEDYEGVQFSVLLRRQRELPFGSKLQNHALNHRLNEEFKKYFPTSVYVPIIRDVKTNRYWLNENLIKIIVDYTQINIAQAVKDIIDAYITARQEAFDEFIVYCQEMLVIQQQELTRAIEFIRGLLRPNIDARVFEIVSYAILKEYYADQHIYWGWSSDVLNAEYLTLYKTGRTNANDGGIDFVMKPLGRFFQVTETIDVGKYFLDIDKVQRYPITFVVKTEQPIQSILNKLMEQATMRYKVKAIVRRYIEAVEEVINIPELMNRFDSVLERGRGTVVIEEIVLQSRVEFNPLLLDKEVK
ncbi:restriction endonuclease [Aphanothece hegewaldii CCALA 016]|uniref:Restriction endonuclease n=1 Tax=Aphanothece hegewaldii CCALA 016 TaxID=2107694 RepID=A0A2T1LW28_9CHRO|nr:restriction endonuclease [Aphanothece hegewaldii]PSF36109.1 restriction endonuclease [Aphanothece hegewaldii CCALA 016]